MKHVHILLFVGLFLAPVFVHAQDVNIENWRQHFLQNQCDKSTTRLEPSICVCDVESDSLGYCVAVGFDREHNGDRLMVYESMINLSQKTLTVPEKKSAMRGPIFVSIWNASGEKLLSEEEIWKKECAERTGTPCIANMPLNGRAFWSDGKPSDKFTPGAQFMGSRRTDYALKTNGVHRVRVVRNLIVDNRKIVFVFDGIKLDVKHFAGYNDAGKSNHLKSFEELAGVLNDAKSDRLFLSDVIAKIETIKPGMIRVDLEGLFEGDGGLSTRTNRKYIYRKFPMIKVEIEFCNIGESEDGRDIITKISKPFLENPIID